MTFLEKAQTFFQRFRTNADEGPSEESMYSRRHDGSLSGYHPNVGRQAQPQQVPDPSAPIETPYDKWGPNPSFGQETGMGQTYGQPGPEVGGFQQAWPQPEPSASFVATGFQGFPPQNQPTQGNQENPFMGYAPPPQAQRMGQQVPQMPVQPVQPPVQQPAQPQQQPAPDNISYMPGGFIGKDGRMYAHQVVVAQITGVPDCYALMETLRNTGSVVINLELMRDRAEMDRCLDLLFGACYALQCQFNQISSRSVYLLTPGTVQVQNAEELRRQGEYEAAQRWPDPSNVAYYQPVMPRYGQNGYGASAPGNGMGRYSAPRSTAAEYTDFGGFPNAGRF